MLVLKRYLHEVLRIGPDVTVEVVRIERGVVTLGVTAPPELKISREPKSEGTDPNVATLPLDDLHAGPIAG